MQLPSQQVIILNSARVVEDLLNNRSSIYGDKCRGVMDEILGWDWGISTMPYGRRWTYARKYIHQCLNNNAVQQYRDVQQQRVRQFLQRTLEEQDGSASIKSVNYLFASIIIEVAYGIRIQGLDDPLVINIMEALETFNAIKVPGAFWVDIFPLLRYLPKWTPGVTFHQYGDLNKPKVAAARERPFKRTVQDIDNGVAPPSMVHDLLHVIREEYTDTHEYSEQEGYLKDAAGTVYGAGVETTHSTVCWFILAMAMHPHIQEKAQRELERAVGGDRLPTHEDYDSLPYVQAIIRETLRWAPAVPMGIPHRVMIDDEYEGYHIPKGCMLVPNIWDVAMCHDPEDYPNPDTFDPERHLDEEGCIDPEVRDPHTIVFGYGRRICAGRYLAKEAIFLTIASILYVFNIRPALDEDGKPMELSISTAAPRSGLFLHPERLDCTLTPRSDIAVKLVTEVYEHDTA
ncbi:hypothetical protein NM688_g2639 [Phlebia brevispora]|uniref:Uncharacterized protein n=1 Tax=Phlebia brevispora TaxID=194682 RepID=A0ACC1T7X7_9APHY|nr:hypothetical protein NM688_g2639 [Phlebia brevispora]